MKRFPPPAQQNHVVDGKQRLVTCFEFVDNVFPVSEQATITSLRGKMFRDLADGQKLDIWRYQFAVEFVPQEEERLITEIFDRINRNVARLTRQELRHAKYEGDFMQEVETSADKMGAFLPANFPVIVTQSRRQMKDMELIGNLLLLIEEGARSYSQDQMDAAYSNREENWVERERVAEGFNAVLGYISDLLRADLTETLARSRLRNQTDFYSLVGAIHKLHQEHRLPDPATAARQLEKFLAVVEDSARRAGYSPADAYYAASRSASNDQGPRQTRINIIVGALLNEPPLP